MWRKQVRIMEGDVRGLEAGLVPEGEMEVKAEDGGAPALLDEDEGVVRQCVLLPLEGKAKTCSSVYSVPTQALRRASIAS